MLTPRLPEGLPEPVDDGACDHLAGMRLPDVPLTTSANRPISMSELMGLTVIYIYPKSGADSSDLPDDWDSIPGARGCTPQSCSFRDHRAELASLGAEVFGLSTQSPNYLAGEVARLQLPFELISDEKLAFARALRLPTLGVRVGGSEVLKRVTLVCKDGVIVHVFYPVFPPDRNADEVIGWLQSQPAA